MIIKNNLNFDSSFPFIIEKKYNELTILNNEKINFNNSEKKIQNLNNINDISNEIITKEISILKNLKIPKKERIFKICKNYSKIKNDSNFTSRKKFRNLKYYNSLNKIENNNSIFINKSNVETKYLKNIINNKDINDNLLSKNILR